MPVQGGLPSCGLAVLPLELLDLATVVTSSQTAAGGRAVLLKGYAFGTAASLTWGLYFVLARLGVTAGLEASDITFMRFIVPGVLLLPWLLAHGPLSFAGLGWKKAVVFALLVGPLFSLLSVGAYHFAPLAHGAVIQPSSGALSAIILSALVLGDRPGAARIVGVLIVIGGLAVLAGPGLFEGGAHALPGDLMFMAGGALWGLFTILQRIWKTQPVQVAASLSVISAAAYTPVYFFFIGPQRLIAAGATMVLAQLLVQGLLSGMLGLLAFNRAVQLLGPSRASLFPAMVPALAVVIGAPVTGDLPTAPQYAGLGLVTLGLLLAIGVLHLPGRLEKQT